MFAENRRKELFGFSILSNIDCSFSILPKVQCDMRCTNWMSQLPHLVSHTDCSSLLDEKLEEVEVALPSSVVQRCGALLCDTV